MLKFYKKNPFSQKQNKILEKNKKTKKTFYIKGTTKNQYNMQNRLSKTSIIPRLKI